MFGAPCSDGRWIWIEVAMVKTNRSPEQMRKMYSSLRALLVNFLSFGNLFVNGGMYCDVV